MKQFRVPPKVQLASSFALFGTIGIIVRYIALPSSLIALIRGIIGTLMLLAFSTAKGARPNLRKLKKKLPLLCLSGAMIGFNWILLFEAYNYTTVATATLCYYFAPIFVTVASPIVLKERLTLRKGCCVAVALVGMVLVSGVLEHGTGGAEAYKGILFGIGAAILYASVILLNKRLGDLTATDRTTLQLGSAALVLLPYVLLTGASSAAVYTPVSIVLLLVVGVLHTGFAYTMYFGAMPFLRAQTIALYSYIDPILAVLLSALLLREPMSLLTAVGAVLILGATFISERTNA